ncbi:MAG: 4Fe-4S dicluster domain-containing protein [bacterium]
MNRREFVSLMGLASSASLLSSCGLDRQSEKLIPYLVPPDDGVIPGRPVYLNTTCAECPAGCGMSVKVLDRRAAKLEGNPANPINTGGLCLRGQASISRLYHPDRLTSPLKKDERGEFQQTTWDDAFATIIDALDRKSAHPESRRVGRRNVFLSSRTSGTLSRAVASFCDETGVERLPELELFSYAAIREANRILFNRAQIPSYRIEDADFLLSLGADLFETFVSPVSHAGQFGRAKAAGGAFEWVHVEPHVSLTGLRADERHVISPGGGVFLLVYLLREVARENLAGDRHIAGMVASFPDLTLRGFAEETGLDPHTLETLSKRLLSARRPLVIAGGVSTMQRSGLDVAVLTGLLQWATGMTGTTVIFDKPEDYSHVGSLGDLETLTADLETNEIGVLFVCDADPLGISAAPISSNPLSTLRAAFANASLSVGLAQFMNTTCEACDLVLPLSDALESWGDAQPRDDVLGLVQPAVAPAHDTKTAGDILIRLAREHRGADTTFTYQEYVIGTLNDRYGSESVDRLLGQGFLTLPTPQRSVTLNREVLEPYLRNIELTQSSVKPVLVIAPSLREYDGRGSALALLREIPDPLTTVSYGPWAAVSSADAAEQGLEAGDDITVTADGVSLTLPVVVHSGLTRGVVMIQWAAAGTPPLEIEPGTGELKTVYSGVTIARAGTRTAVPVLAGSMTPEGRVMVPQPGHEDEHGLHGEPYPTFYPEHEHKDYRWGIVIDLDRCTGCSACVAACYVENNLAVVGPGLHLQGREMSWIRIEPHDQDGGEVDFMPMLCQHCDNAPCETVCPVYATYHNPEGLNAQVYNRCVGTRYCSNNCPYKVRRFNWFDFKRPTAANTTRNAEVSVRGRGVMEKCTFCVQRIRSARDAAKDEKRRIKDGEVVPACAQSCPAGAITFGSLKDEGSHVSKLARSDRAFQALGHLGTDPGVFYLRRTRRRTPRGGHGTDHG